MSSVASILADVRSKKISVSEVVQHCFDTIHQRNEELNAFVFVNEEEALFRAQLIDEGKVSAGHLTGVPYATKDNILVKDQRVTAGSRMLESYYATYDATVVKKLYGENAVRLGATNMDEFAMGSSTETSAFGVTKNPHDVTRVSGGSSGGSAVAVASGMVPFALGSDTGGSIRQPAAFCGVVGYKPSYGTVSRHGLIAMSSSLDQIGLFTCSVADAQVLIRHIIGRDEYDATSYSLDSLEQSHLDISKVRIGVVPDHFSSLPHSDVQEMLQKALQRYERAGATIKEISLPHMQYALATYYILMPAEVSSNLARLDGIRYGFSADAPTLSERYDTSRYQGFGKEVKRRVMLGSYVLSSGYYDAYYKKSQHIRALIAKDYSKAFEDVDVLITPTTPDVAFRIGEKTTDPLQMYLEDIYTVGVNLAGLPALSVPAGMVERDGAELPVGMQLIARQKDDIRLLEIAAWFEKDT